jgi:hypothetical protein
MNPLTSLPRRAARSFLPAVIAAAAIGAAAVATPAQASQSHGALRAAQARPAAATFTWTALKLATGWKSAATSTYLTGTPAWSVVNHVVYLRGSVTCPTAACGYVVAQLPAAARPTHVLYLQVNVNGNNPGIVSIGTDGSIEAYGIGLNNANSLALTSLSGISYPTAAMKPVKLKLVNHWTSSQGIYNTGDPSLAISGGVVYLSGSIYNGTPGSVVTTLPKAAWPAQTLTIHVYTYSGSTGALQISPTGVVKVNGKFAGSYTSLASISYPARGAIWTKFVLNAKWTAVSAPQAPSFTVIGGVVYLNGAMYEKSYVNGLFTLLPAKAQSAHVQIIEIVTSGNVPDSLGVSNLGIVVPTTSAQKYTSLAGVAYPKNA